jgi:hypothetical protein
MCSREEDERLGEVEGGACGSTRKRMSKRRKKIDDRLEEKKPNKIVWLCTDSSCSHMKGHSSAGAARPAGRNRSLLD